MGGDELSFGAPPKPVNASTWIPTCTTWCNFLVATFSDIINIIAFALSQDIANRTTDVICT